MRKNQFLVLFGTIILISTAIYVYTARSNARPENEIEQIKRQIRIKTDNPDWRIRKECIMNIPKRISRRDSRFRNDEEVLDLMWRLFIEEIEFIKANPKIYLPLDSKEYRQYFENLLKIIYYQLIFGLDNEKRVEKYKIHRFLVDIPYWRETAFRIIANEGGEDILPQLLERLDNKKYNSKQDLRDGIIAITYKYIAEGKCSKKSINLLKKRYIRFLSEEAYDKDDSLLVKSHIRKSAITGLGVIGDRDVIPKIEPFLNDPYYKRTLYDPKTGFRMKKKITYYPVREETEKVIKLLKAGKRLTINDIIPQFGDD